ncbi:MAG: hypothetical protein HY898_14660 [Deltaproteobacteria bacterium]|nr:hypothetical protein [Deltaproteobacteria bacterium]
MFRPTSHNSYQPSTAAHLSDVLAAVSSVEIDIWDDENLDFGAQPNSWFVRHMPFGGNDSNGSPPGNLQACLCDVLTYSNAHPGHEVLTLFIEKKEGWGDTRRPADLDQLLRNIFGPKLYTPSNLAGSTHARAAARNGAWPTMAALRGKVMVILHGGRWTGIGANQVLSDYVQERGASAVAFVAPETDDAKDIAATPGGFEDACAPWVVFYNIGEGNEHLAPMIRAAGCVSRVWGVANNDPSFSRLARLAVNFIGFDDFRQTGWNGGMMKGVVQLRAGLHHHHKRGNDCEHGLWATDDAQGHHHHKRGTDCPGGTWATDDVAGHHHHLRGSDCEHNDWATDDQVMNGPLPAPEPSTANHHHHKRGQDCQHGVWATSEANGHHHHKHGTNCEHGEWATDEFEGHHHHLRGSDCEHGSWATSDRIAKATPQPYVPHHHHKRGSDCEHGKWATDDVNGHHHHLRGDDCEHGQWATDDVNGHHHHKRGSDCTHGQWATDGD